METETEFAAFAHGCMWGHDTRFKSIDGVVDAQVGYFQSLRRNPSYFGFYIQKWRQQALGRQPSIVEGVQVEYDPTIVKYQSLLTNFVGDLTQDPNTRWDNRLFIGYYNEQQKEIAEKDAIRRNDSVSRIEQVENFYPAELTHQDFNARHNAKFYVTSPVLTVEAWCREGYNLVMYPIHGWADVFRGIHRKYINKSDS